MSKDKIYEPLKKKDSWRETIGTLVIAVVLSLIIRSFFVEIFWIPSGSMMPSLLKGDLIVVSKTSYGYSRFSLPYGNALPLQGRIFGEEPLRGDILVFHGSKKNIDYVKRLIGLPGDRVQVMRGRLFINGVPVRRLALEDYKGENGFQALQYTENLPGSIGGSDREHLIIEMMGDDGYADNTPEYIVPEGHYFVMGDSRDNSVDSRYLGDVGFVPYDHLVGRVEMVLASFGSDSPWWYFWEWPFSLRFERVGLSVP